MCADERAFAILVCCQRASGLRQKNLRLDAQAVAVGLVTRLARMFAMTLCLLGFYFRVRFDRKACLKYMYSLCRSNTALNTRISLLAAGLGNNSAINLVLSPRVKVRMSTLGRSLFPGALVRIWGTRGSLIFPFRTRSPEVGTKQKAGAPGRNEPRRG